MKDNGKKKTKNVKSKKEHDEILRKSYGLGEKYYEDLEQRKK